MFAHFLTLYDPAGTPPGSGYGFATIYHLPIEAINFAQSSTLSYTEGSDGTESNELDVCIKAKGVKKFCRQMDEMAESVKCFNQELEKASLLIKKLTDLKIN